MSDEKKYTLRDMVKAQREAFIAGDEWNSTWRIRDGSVEAQAKYKYPLPKVARPRVVKCGHYEWRVVGETLEVNSGGGWARAHPACAADAERVVVWADLYANPTDEVEDDA